MGLSWKIRNLSLYRKYLHIAIMFRISPRLMKWNSIRTFLHLICYFFSNVIENTQFELMQKNILTLAFCAESKVLNLGLFRCWSLLTTTATRFWTWAHLLHSPSMGVILSRRNFKNKYIFKNKYYTFHYNNFFINLPLQNTPPPF